MKDFLSLLGFGIGVLLILIGFGIVVLWVYWWFLGLFTLGATWFNLPYWGTFIAIAFVAVAARSLFVLFTIVGFVGWVWVLNWHWFTGMMVYLPTVVILFTSFASVTILAIITFGAKLLENVKSNHRRRK